jgi:hypothetical protein
VLNLSNKVNLKTWSTTFVTIDLEPLIEEAWISISWTSLTRRGARKIPATRSFELPRL